jgi:large subunit ribosomal protein L29
VAKKGMQELVDLTSDELAAQELELREELFQTRFKNQMRQLDNPLKIRHLRRQIARVRTLMTTPAKASGARATATTAAAPKAKTTKAAKATKAAKPAKANKKEKAAKAPAKEKAR